MSAIKVKLVRSLSGHPEDHRATVAGLGLKRIGRERILPDTPSTLGMINKVGYLVEWSRIEGSAPESTRGKQKVKKT